MKRLLAILVFGLVACSPSRSDAGASPSRPPSTTATPNALADMPVTKVNFSCRLPVVASISQSSPGLTRQGGFITFPAGRLAQDPAGTMHSREVEGDYVTTAAPVLYGDGVFPFYDRALSRWVPTRASQSLPDGSGYAYMTWNAQAAEFTAHVVNVASRSSQSFKLSSPSFPLIADYQAAGVYIISGSAIGGPGDQVWLLDPLTGAIKQLGHIHIVWTVRDGYAWVAPLDARDKTVSPAPEIAPANSLVRIDLTTGAETIWFYRAGSYPWLLGLDSSDRPVLLLGATPTSNEIRLIDQPGSLGALVYSGDTSGLDYLQGDRDRLWFGSPRGIYLYSSNGGFHRVFAYNADPATSDRIDPAGFCR
jgi:hypothetical protein